MDCSPRPPLLRQHAIHVRLMSHVHIWGTTWYTWRSGGTAMNRAKICSNRRGVRVSPAQLTEIVFKKRTCPKLKDTTLSWTLEGCGVITGIRVVSVVHIHTLMGTIPMDMKNTNGNRRLMVFLFGKNHRVRVGHASFQSRAYHTVENFGLYRSPGGQISFLANTIETGHDNTAKAERATDGGPMSPCRTSISWTVVVLQDP